ncbi:MAG TPA: DUF4170 domain-containing protein [Rhizobiales bacterium]|nr:DUF4170 domain-containing protein [Hyphomicrobiales bacterium]
MTDYKPKQLLHMVFGGALEDLDGVTFKDLEHLDIIGIFPDYQTAHDAWERKARETMDIAEMRYFIVHLHKLLDPEDA